MFEDHKEENPKKHGDNVTLHKKWSFPLRIFSVNVTKSLKKNFILVQCKQVLFEENLLSGNIIKLLWKPSPDVIIIDMTSPLRLTFFLGAKC